LQNLLLDKQGNLKISDFGLSTLTVGAMDAADGGIGSASAAGSQRAALLHTTCGSPNYVAPEVRIAMPPPLPSATPLFTPSASVVPARACVSTP